MAVFHHPLLTRHVAGASSRLHLPPALLTQPLVSFQQSDSSEGTLIINGNSDN
jgi:hypothetical protein